MYYRLTAEQMEKFTLAFEYESQFSREECDKDPKLIEMKKSWKRRDFLAYQSFVKQQMTQGSATENAEEKVKKTGCCIVM